MSPNGETALDVKTARRGLHPEGKRLILPDFRLEQQPDHQVFLGSDAEEKLSLGDLLDLTLHLSLQDRGCGRPYLVARPQRELL